MMPSTSDLVRNTFLAPFWRRSKAYRLVHKFKFAAAAGCGRGEIKALETLKGEGKGGIAGESDEPDESGEVPHPWATHAQHQRSMVAHRAALIHHQPAHPGELASWEQEVVDN